MSENDYNILSEDLTEDDIELLFVLLEKVENTDGKTLKTLEDIGNGCLAKKLQEVSTLLVNLPEEGASDPEESSMPSVASHTSSSQGTIFVKEEDEIESILDQQYVTSSEGRQTTLPVMMNRFKNQDPPAIDEIGKKRRCEAENMVKQISKRTNYTCGVSYSGDLEEHKFSDGIKKDLREKLPALKNHRHIFHYMAFATTDRLECSHCRLCPNTYPSPD